MNEPLRKLKQFGGVPVLFPGIYGLFVAVYFLFLTGFIPLSDVFPYIYYLYFPCALLSVFFLVLCIIHLVTGTAETAVKIKVLWLFFFLLFTGIALPIYWYRHIKE